MIGIDSNILLRIFLAETAGEPDTSSQLTLVRSLISGKRGALFINHVVIAETLWVLRQKMKLPKPAIAGAISQMLQFENTVVEGTEAVFEALETFLDHPGDFSDHLIGAINRRAGCRTTFTFDKTAARSPNLSELKG